MDGDNQRAQDPYSSSYNDISVHELMLRDKPRTLAYKNFIEKYAHLFKDKIVMDVGAGTGILSLFAAKAGAKRVYAIECSDMAHLCNKLVQQNGHSDQIVVVKGKVEDIRLDDLKNQVDIIISEWMGFYLFHECMLFSVLAARDRFLKPDGVMLPTGAHLFACPTSLESQYRESSNFWKDAYGFDFSPAVEVAMSQKTLEPQIIALKESDLLSEPHFVTGVEVKYAEVGEFENIKVDMKFKILRYGVVRGLSIWFDVLFDIDSECNEEIVQGGNDNENPSHDVKYFSTGPKFPETHWKQTVVVLPEAILVSPDATFDCQLILSRSQTDRRKYSITVAVPESECTSEEEDDGDEDWHDSVSDIIQNKLS